MPKGKQVALKLNDEKGYRDGLGCVPTALCAISGLTPEEIASILQKAAAECGDTISGDLRRDYNVKHWLRAIATMGADYSIAHDFMNLPQLARPTVEGYLRNAGEFLELVYCDHAAIPEMHVFAMERGELVDIYTGGKKRKIVNLPPPYNEFRVRGVFRIINP